MSKIKMNLNLDIVVDGDKITVSGEGERCQCVCGGQPEPTPEPEPIPEPEPTPEPTPVPEGMPKDYGYSKLYTVSGPAGSHRERVDYPVFVYQMSRFNAFYICKTGGKKQLYTAIVKDGKIDFSTEKHLPVGTQKVVHVQAAHEERSNQKWLNFVTDSNGFHLYSWLVNRGEVQGNPTQAPTNTSDVIATTSGPSIELWKKIDNFVKHPSTGQTIDYIRRWFKGDSDELTFNGLGSREQVYSMAVHKADKGYVAMLGLFKIENDGANQKGGIYPVWATSKDGIVWDLPFGTKSALDAPDKDRMVLPTQFMPFGKELYLVYSDNAFSHNTYTPGDVTGGAYVRYKMSDVEGLL